MIKTLHRLQQSFDKIEKDYHPENLQKTLEPLLKFFDVSIIYLEEYKLYNEQNYLS